MTRTSSVQRSVASEQRSLTSGDGIIEFPYHSFRNISCPEDLENGRRVCTGHAPATSILNLPTNQNVREYLVDVEGKKRHALTQVHKAIRDTLLNRPDIFSILNGGVVIVARDYTIDENKKVVRLVDPSIINGSQTQGILRTYYKAEQYGKDESLPPVHVTYELIVTNDQDLVAEVSVARNYQNDVMTISIAGRRGQLDELEASFQEQMSKRQLFSDKKLRKSESDLSEDHVATERLIQVMTALIPKELWPNRGEADNPNKVYTYAMKTRCLKDFQTTYLKAKDIADPEHEHYADLYQYFLDIVADAYDLYEKWKAHQGFRGTNLRSGLKRDGKDIEEVSDGIVFPILAAHAAFIVKTEEGWRLVPPRSFTDEVLIKAAKTVHQEIAKGNPNVMGKSKACYSQLHQITTLYRELSK